MNILAITIGGQTQRNLHNFVNRLQSSPNSAAKENNVLAGNLA